METKEKPKIEEIKYLGMMMGQNAWGNDDAEKIINWYKSQLKREIDNNIKLEQENFILSIQKPKDKWFSWF